ncbi:MAG: class II fumarate hydratase [Anaerolineae bacterium]
MNQPTTSPVVTETTREERDSLGPVQVPAQALWGAQTQRAVENFPVSGITFGRRFLKALGLVKLACAGVNRDLDLLDDEVARAIVQAAEEVVAGRHDGEFPIDIFQTGSGTSTNMNANEVIANRANQILGQPLGAKKPVHPNDHVNRSQSSNDVIPTALHVAAYQAAADELLPALDQLADAIESRAAEHGDLVKTGRTHLMDAMPVTVGQEMGGWAAQVRLAAGRIRTLLPELGQLCIGGTAVGTGLNAPEGFSKAVAARLSALTGHPFSETENHFAAQASSDTPVAMSGAVKSAAVSLMKIANDLRWMNSGPNAGLAEIALPALQPGSSIMPGKINPVIPEAVTQVCAQVMGNDVAVTVGGQAANFELSVMQPVIARNLIESIAILAGAARTLAEKAINGLVVNRERIGGLVEKNPILVTALNPVIGYDKAAVVAKKAFAEGRAVKDVARDLTDLPAEELDRLLDPRNMT